MKNPFFKKPNIILVDDHLIFRQGLKSLIVFENLGNVIGEASDGKEFIDLLSLPAPDLVLMDIDMPHMNGMEATQKGLELVPNLKIIVFSMFGDEEYFRKMVALGVKGYILKSTGINEVEKAINDVMNGKTYFSNVQSTFTESKTDLKKPKDTKEESKVPIPWW
jgi:Response regulator containing a CheY-like receiver domain and an HTH DNA-binding domain